ncbi:hypothetical protein CYMTET_15785 [Cymbomonas tetramitiformis]|uniref:Uncharacterized protein n=1 Tax=Cymbomonas tetramitiformis TaxID=36881 RepID=A0AAE0GEU1_9CHLO|nr:hypothetical protein CYMTET_15785 [Cymbomonas tetramitiformis]
MSGPNVVVVNSPVTEEKVEIGFVDTGDLRTVPFMELQPITNRGFDMRAQFVTKLYGPKTDLLQTRINLLQTRINVFGGADMLCPDKTTGLVCTGMPVLLKEDHETLPMPMEIS